MKCSQIILKIILIITLIIKLWKKKKINSFHIFAKKEEDKLSKIWNTIFPLKQIQTHKFVPGAA